MTIDDDDDYFDSDDWGGMTRWERMEYLDMQLLNGNNMDAVSFLMHDGDIRADSVRLALDIVARSIITQPNNANATLDFINRLNRLIDAWETR